MNFKQLLSAAALATLALVPSQTNAQQLRAKKVPHLLKPQNSTLMLKAQKAPLGRELWGNVVKSTRWDSGTPEYGFYSFGASGSIDINEMFTDDNMYANASGAMVGNRLDVIRYNREQNVMYTISTTLRRASARMFRISPTSVCGLQRRQFRLTARCTACSSQAMPTQRARYCRLCQRDTHHYRRRKPLLCGARHH